MTDPYAVLGVSPTATQDEIAHVYRRQLRDNHPDRRSGELNSRADEHLRQIVAAYALLRDPTRRAAYDRAHPIWTANPGVEIPVNRIGSRDDDEPPLWAGPVRWQR
ncbi:MAG: J domain-containing protein [Mycobacterium sp.]|nr:J domain-containing protein [Mycobacterium sp.]MBV9721169.1 J domain-containing protein [Mycobacterium sp.]